MATRRRKHIRNHPFLPDGEYLYYRFVMAEKVGRKLHRDEIVHHKDGDETNDDPSNLKIVTHRWHATHHLKGKKRSVIVCQRISEGQKGRINSPETREKISKALKGKKWSRKRKQHHKEVLTQYFKDNPRVSPTGRPWVKLGISRRTWYRRERKRK